MRVLRETEMSNSATSYRIEIEEDDLRTDETSEQRFERYLREIRADRSRRRQRRDDSDTASSFDRA